MDMANMEKRYKHASEVKEYLGLSAEEEKMLEKSKNAEISVVISQTILAIFSQENQRLFRPHHTLLPRSGTAGAALPPDRRQPPADAAGIFTKTSCFFVPDLIKYKIKDCPAASALPEL